MNSVIPKAFTKKSDIDSQIEEHRRILDQACRERKQAFKDFKDIISSIALEESIDGIGHIVVQKGQKE